MKGSCECTFKQYVNCVLSNVRSVSRRGVGTIYSPMKCESSKKRFFLDYTEKNRVASNVPIVAMN